MECAIDSAEMDEVMTIKLGGHLIEDIVRDGVQVPGHFSLTKKADETAYELRERRTGAVRARQTLE